MVGGSSSTARLIPPAAATTTTAAMITFRRSIAATIFLLTSFFFLLSSHSNSNTRPAISTVTRAELHSTPPYPDPAQTPTATNQQAAHTQSGSSGSGISKPAVHQPHNPPPPDNLARKPLRERLRYQFPYDVQSKFPAYIWQTWKYTPASGEFEEKLRPLEASWTEWHPTFVHEVITDEAADPLLRYLYAAFPEILDAYRSLPLPVLRADFFRYLILLARGGIYSDIDTSALQPAEDWLPRYVNRSTIGLIIGIEADALDREDWYQWYSRQVQFCQWTIQSKPGHPVLRDVVATITEETLRMKQAGILTPSKMDKSIVEFTGPAVWTDAVFRYFNDPNYFEAARPPHGRNVTAMDFSGITVQRQLGDVVVLPITSFSPGVRQMGAKDPDDPMAFVKHEFEGTWKPEQERFIGHQIAVPTTTTTTIATPEIQN
ncbi:alpha 1,6-mannosyltransferase [Blastomyces gilchristii SLH14081]|uniref:Alpha 1,6-mannosyltransferase n=1 Tax=Blastomyces gilchristii (strain SLH14081) TaxID=559298 RepID=A0A179U9H5_BLAGS|nr:alpha 1,6-mannosyltransferase [Blastomyces gilchristii SLH14081]OAT04624.1 alpha 1,6-mannosyltransferase [Blastomyces gilchristii SLH14081]